MGTSALISHPKPYRPCRDVVEIKDVFESTRVARQAQKRSPVGSVCRDLEIKFPQRVRGREPRRTSDKHCCGQQDFAAEQVDQKVDLADLEVVGPVPERIDVAIDRVFDREESRVTFAQWALRPSDGNVLEWDKRSEGVRRREYRGNRQRKDPSGTNQFHCCLSFEVGGTETPATCVPGWVKTQKLLLGKALAPTPAKLAAPGA